MLLPDPETMFFGSNIEIRYMVRDLINQGLFERMLDKVNNRFAHYLRNEGLTECRDMQDYVNSVLSKIIQK